MVTVVTVAPLARYNTYRFLSSCRTIACQNRSQRVGNEAQTGGVYLRQRPPVKRKMGVVAMLVGVEDVPVVQGFVGEPGIVDKVDLMARLAVADKQVFEDAHKPQILDLFAKLFPDLTYQSGIAALSVLDPPTDGAAVTVAPYQILILLYKDTVAVSEQAERDRANRFGRQILGSGHDVMLPGFPPQSLAGIARGRSG